jgi:PAS domain S-box-containing protein
MIEKAMVKTEVCLGPACRPTACLSIAHKTKVSHNFIRRSRYGFRGMRASDNQSPVMWENGCRATRLLHGKGDRVVPLHRMTCSLVAIFVVLTAVCAAGSEPKRVLVVHSFGSVAPPFTTHSIAFETELVEKMGERVDLDEVSLDMARYADPTLQEALVEYLQKRQSHWQPDLVVPIGSPAGVFVARYRDRLFPETPILYTGMDRRPLPPDALEKNAAFIGENFDLPGFIEDILQIAPATKNIAVVIGASPVEQYWAAAFRKEFERFANRINFIWLDDLSLDQMLEKTRALPPNSYIFLILLLRDATGVTHNADEALQRIHAVANAPINGIFQHQLGLGIVGGRLYQAELEGIESARIAVRILHGEPASNFPPKIVGPLSPRYDWRELKRWKINAESLPPGSVISFREPTAWERYGVWIIAGVSLCFVQAVLIFGLLANLAKRRRAERSLIESEDRVALAADAAQLGVWEIDAATNEVWVSDKVRDLFQIDPGTDVDYAAFQERVYPDDQLLRDSAIKRAIETKGGYEIEYRIVLPDGAVRWMSGRARCISDGDGRSTRLLGVSMDVTKRKRAERETMEQRDELFHLSRVASLGQLSGSLAHELNQPLGIILSNAQAAHRMLAGDAPDIPELREILSDIVGENLRAGEVITRLRALLKRGETRLLPLVLNGVIKDVLRLLRSDLVARGVTIETTLADGLPDVPGDEVQLQQVLLNIITNACDTMAENLPKDRILRITTKLRSGKVRVSMEDQGRGLPGGDVSRIFQPFFTTKSHGLGLGLSICRSIIAAHHGSLWAELNEGRGLTLHLELDIIAPTAS